MGRSAQQTIESPGRETSVCLTKLSLVRTIDVCLSPPLLPLHDISEKTVVVVDILRATSSMVTAFAHGMSRIRPVAHIDECLELQRQGYLTAGERDGIKITEFDFGNSPLDYRQTSFEGKSLAMTTTNGTLAIEQSKAASQLVIGAFLNVSAVADFLKQQIHDVLVVCAGWKGHVNLEDTLFAGALLDSVSPQIQAGSDAALMAKTIYHEAQPDCLAFLSQSSHVQRLTNMGLMGDIAFCLQQDTYSLVPQLQGSDLVVPTD